MQGSPFTRWQACLEAAAAGGVVPGTLVRSEGQGHEVRAWRDLWAHRVGMSLRDLPEPDVVVPALGLATVLALAQGGGGYPYALLLHEGRVAWAWTGVLVPA